MRATLNDIKDTGNLYDTETSKIITKENASRMTIWEFDNATGGFWPISILLLEGDGGVFHTGCFQIEVE